MDLVGIHARDGTLDDSMQVLDPVPVQSAPSTASPVPEGGFQVQEPPDSSGKGGGPGEEEAEAEMELNFLVREEKVDLKAPLLIYVSKLRDMIKDPASVQTGEVSCNTGRDAGLALNILIETAIERAANRCKSNNRKIIQPHDIGTGKAKGKLLVGRRVREAFNNLGCTTSDGAMAAMHHVANTAVIEAANRARLNGRKTVRATDF